MADLRSHPEQNQEHEGASQSEVVIEACRRNNTDLLQEIISQYSNTEAVAKLLNEARTVLGNYAYHEAARRGNYDIIDMLLDQEGFECDPISRREGDTPLHSAIRWANEASEDQREFASSLIEMMLEAGSDPRIRNKAKLKPAELVDPRNTKLRNILQESEYVTQNQGDFIDVAAEEDEGPTGSNSDSDSEGEGAGAPRQR